jgi:hypothetical protein
MIKSKKVCEIDGCNFPVFSHSLCYFHSKKKLLKKSYKPIKKISTKGVIAKEKKKEYTLKQWEFFLEIWNERPHVCYETGKPIYGEPLSIYFHHCLEKNPYPQFALEKWNIVIVTGETHSQVHSNIDKTPKIKQLTKELKEKYL